MATCTSPKVFRVNLLLHCTKTNVSEREKIELGSPPQSVLDVKREVEKRFSIPKCVQVVSYDGSILEDGVSLSTLKFRDGDTFRVEYLAKGSCSDLTKIIAWFEQLVRAFDTSNSSDVVAVARVGMQNGLIKNLPTYFSPWRDPTGATYVNKLHFVDYGGIEKLVKVYNFLLQTAWNESSYDVSLKYLECWLVKGMWVFSETAPLRRLLIQHSMIQMLTKSLLRVRLEEGKRIGDYDTSGGTYQQSLLVETVFGSIAALLNLIYMPECQLEVATNRDILHQVSCVSLDPSLSNICTHLVVSFFGNLAFSPETHQYVADSVFIQRLLRASGRVSTDPENGPLLTYFTVLFLTQVCLVSPHCVMSEWYPVITNLMESFIRANTPKEIRGFEISHGFSCSILIPYVKLVYLPNTPQENAVVGKLHLVSLKVNIFALQNMLGREDNREKLMREGLLDFVICIPQYVPPSLRPQAEELVQMVVSSPDIPEGPPKLLNLVKARLAKMHFGLEQVLSLSVSEIVSIFS